MNYEMVMEVLKELGENAIIDEMSNRKGICVEINDFEGFDENWEEVFCEYDEELVEKVWNILKTECVEYKCEFEMYEYFMFNGFEVVWGYGSFNI
jgi:hypothetical protein